MKNRLLWFFIIQCIFDFVSVLLIGLGLDNSSRGLIIAGAITVISPIAIMYLSYWLEILWFSMPYLLYKIKNKKWRRGTVEETIAFDYTLLNGKEVEVKVGPDGFTSIKPKYPSYESILMGMVEQDYVGIGKRIEEIKSFKEV